MEIPEEQIKFAFMHYLDEALITFEEKDSTISNAERIKIYYEAYKKSITELVRTN